MTSNLLVFGSFLVAETTRDLGLLLKGQTLVEFFCQWKFRTNLVSVFHRNRVD